MPAVVAIPQVVEELLVQFGDFLPNEPAQRHFAEYPTSLFIAEHDCQRHQSRVRRHD